jgi:ABC-type polysaccharide/polyol phosphate export permease
MNNKVFEKVTEYIDAIAAKLGVAAEHVYGVLVRQQVAEGITDIVTGVIILVLVITGALIFSKKIKVRFIEDEFDAFILFIGGLLFLVLFVAPIGYSIENISDGIKHIVNPEYYAIKEILRAIK